VRNASPGQISGGQEIRKGATRSIGLACAALVARVILALVVSRVTCTQPTLVREPFHRPGWVYEENYDGWRMLAFNEGVPSDS
jgi:hypothetical protein